MNWLGLFNPIPHYFFKYHTWVECISYGSLKMAPYLCNYHYLHTPGYPSHLIKVYLSLMIFHKQCNLHDTFLDPKTLLRTSVFSPSILLIPFSILYHSLLNTCLIWDSVWYSSQNENITKEALTTCSPPKDMSMSKPQEPVNVTLFGKSLCRSN